MGRVQANLCTEHLGRVRTGCFECVIDQLEAMLRLEWVRIAPDTTPPGSLCMLCDSMAGCSHPRVRCAACGTEGLKENWPFRCCNVTDIPAATAAKTKGRRMRHLIPTMLLALLCSAYAPAQHMDFPNPVTPGSTAWLDYHNNSPEWGWVKVRATATMSDTLIEEVFDEVWILTAGCAFDQRAGGARVS